MNCVWKHAPVQSGEFSVLLALADYADERGSCFPSIPVLARKARLKERQTQNCIRSLVDEGFVRVEPGAGPKGCNRYVVVTEAIEARSICRRPVAAEEVEETSDAAGGANIAPLQSATGGVQPSAPGGAVECTQTIIEPPVEPSLPEREARESGLEETQDRQTPDDPKKIEAAFWRTVKDWPGFAGMPKEPARRAFLALSAEERAEAERKLPAWLALLKAQRKSYTPAPATYFGEKLWLDVPEAEDAQPTAIEAPPFGPVWGALRWREILLVAPKAAPPPASAFIAELLKRDDETGHAERLKRQAVHGWPQVGFRDRQAESRKGFATRPEDAALAALMEPVPVGSATFEAWREEHEKRGWPWIPDPGAMRVVFFPRGGPAGLEAFGEAVRAGVGVGTEADQQARKAG